MIKKTVEQPENDAMEQLRRVREEHRKTVIRLVQAVRTITPQQAVASLAERAA